MTRLGMSSSRPSRSVLPLLAVFLLLAAGAPGAAAQARSGERGANVLLISVDTLRADRLSGYGYEHPTSPAIDRLLASGARFDAARTVEPLTGPAVGSMLTSLYPHEHGSTRNGLALRPDLPSLAKELERRGYRTAAFVANWTLKDDMSGLGEHFEHFEEVLTRKRWFGLVAGEATAEDVNTATVDWLDEHADGRKPFFVWVHYVEPHAPYEFQGEVAARVGARRRDEATRSDRYDTEVAFVDHFVGRLVERVEEDPALAGDTLVVFTSDHGESLGEHDYWGHGRKLYEPGLHIPLVFYQPGAVREQRITAPASILDIPPTVLSLVGLPSPGSFRGVDWAPVLRGEAEPDPDRPLLFQAHKGAVLDMQLNFTESQAARREGLMALGLLQGGVKEIAQVNRNEHRIYDLREDPEELNNLNGAGYQPSDDLQGWIDHVNQSLADLADGPPVNLSEEDVEKLEALGYVD